LGIVFLFHSVKTGISGCEQILILSLLKITPRNFFIYLQKELLPEKKFGLKFKKKSFSAHLAVQQEQ
jgi:hypothetical protein